MIISKSYKFIFIHNHKTGGHSVMESLKEFMGDEDSIIDDGFSLQLNPNMYVRSGQSLCLHKHCNVNQIRDVIGNEDFQLFKFAFVRNPWDRMVSYYNWILGTTWDDEKKICATVKNMKFDEFINSDFILNCTSFKSMLCDKKGKVLCDYIGRVENFEKDFTFVCQILNIPKNVQVRHSNASNRKKDYRVYYSEQTKRRVQDVFSWDIDYFNYTF